MTGGEALVAALLCVLLGRVASRDWHTGLWYLAAIGLGWYMFA